MYKTHNLLPNQVITNVTKDVLRVTSIKGWGSHKIRVILTADVYEFAENGVYSPQRNKTINLDKNHNIKTSEQLAKEKYEIGDTVCFKEDKTGIIIKGVLTGISNDTLVCIDYQYFHQTKVKYISKSEIFNCD